MNGDIVQNIFTGYVNTALLRTRRDYISRQARTAALELTMEEGLLDLAEEKRLMAEDGGDLSCALALPWSPEEILGWLRTQVGWEMERALRKLTREEVVILHAKVFRQMTFREIGQHLGQDWEKIAASYSYARKKLGKELGKELKAYGRF